jgi:hypothetical protein
VSSLKLGRVCANNAKRAGVNFVWEQMRAGKRGGKRAIKRGIAISIFLAERHSTGAHYGHYEGRCLAERALRGYVVRVVIQGGTGLSN